MTGALKAGLYIVSTPIGNAQDLSLRALETLRESEIVLCEDTRVAQRLFALHALKPRRLVRYDDHARESTRTQIIAQIEAGRAVALTSDAGTPLISDPGYRLVRAVQDAGLPVHPVPGASSVLAALAASGLPSDRFTFVGFLPSRAPARRRVLLELVSTPGTLIIFEAARRAPESLQDIADIFGAREGAIAREMTKRFEEIRRAPLPELAQSLSADAPPKGELVLLIGPGTRKPQKRARNTHAKGHMGELAALALLLCKGYRPVARRARTKLGEVDIIARRGRLLIFVEVKARGGGIGAAAEAIRGEQRRRITRAAKSFLARRADLAHLSVRFDAVLIAPYRLPQHLPDAWRADSA